MLGGVGGASGKTISTEIVKLVHEQCALAPNVFQKKISFPFHLQ